MDYIFLTGILGSLFSLMGAAWPDKKDVKPFKSFKNWMFAVGGLVLLLYALLGYLFNDGPIFYVFLEMLIVIASLLMMLDTDDRIDLAVISLTGLGFIIWSFILFEGMNTVCFIVGLAGLSLGYAFQAGTLRRNMALLGGSLLIAVFSYIESSWIFFWLNVFFAGFSAYYLYLVILSRRKKSLKEKILGFFHRKK